MLLILSVPVCGGTMKHLDSEKCMIIWDKATLTDLSVTVKGPDIVFNDKRYKCALLIDISCPCDTLK